MSNSFSWPKLPETDAEFEAVMQAIDGVLAARGLKPAQRPLNVSPLLWEAFGWEGNILPPRELASRPGFKGQVLLAKAYRWYDQIYADKIKMDSSLAHIPVVLGHDIWRARIILVYGRVQMFVDRDLSNRGNRMGSGQNRSTFNILCAVDGLSQELSARLMDAELERYAKLTKLAYKALVWREGLPRNELLTTARGDFSASTEDVLARRHAQARWAAQQAVEKTLKGLLAIGGIAFPTGGSRGHDLLHLAQLLEQGASIAIDSSDLTAASCSPRVRYGEEPSTDTQALNANHAVLRILEQMAECPHSASFLGKRSSTSASVTS
ncbi:MAG: HEPN domain-containing protein [Steroidobacteraceae bacterium]